MSKKLLSSIISVVLVLAMFAGCQSAPPPASSQGTAPDSSAQPANPVTDSTPSAEGGKAAVLLPGSANDGSWNQFGYEAIKLVEGNLGIEVAYSENVGAIDQLQALRDYASKGYDVVFGHSGSFEDDMHTVGAEFPDTNFVIIAGANGSGENVIAVDTAPWQYGYAYGWYAGKITKTGKIGYVTAMEDVQTMNNLVGSWRDGAKNANPDIETTVVYINDMGDVAQAREAALALAAAGCDVIMHELNAGSQGVIDICKERDIKTIGRGPEHVEYAPEQVLSCAVFDWGPKYVSLAEQALNGELGGGAYFFGYHTETPGFVFRYDDANEWNPGLTTPEMHEAYQKEVVEMFKADPIRNYTAEDAKGGTM